MEPPLRVERRITTNELETAISGKPGDVVGPARRLASEPNPSGRRIRLAAITGAMAKAIALVAQVIAVAVAGRALGQDGFGLFVVITSLVSWVSLAGIGIAPGLTLTTARAAAEGNDAEAANQFVVALLLMLTVATLVIVGTLLLGATGIVDDTLSEWMGSTSDDGRTALQVMAVLVAAQLVVVVPESAQLGLQRQHVTNLWAAAGSAAAIVGMFAAGGAIGSVTAFLAISQGPQVVARFVNGVAFVVRHQRLMRPAHLRLREQAARLIGSGIAFAGLSMATVISLQVGLIIVAASTDTASLALAGVIVRGYMLEVSGLSLISTPTWPAIARAAALGERQWILHAYRSLTRAALAYSGAAALVILVALEPLIEVWTGMRVTDNALLRVLLAAFIVVNGWAHANAMTLVGLGLLGFTAVTLIAESVLVVALVAAFVPVAGVSAYVGALAVAAVLVSGWLLPWRVSRRLNERGGR